ncbi:MAG: putative glycosyltransferase [Gemmatimonadetes bacterium]|jgi:glycosyltransferase involved in cell wall biosynthesis|nr:putative glycosyltransferase [Gemmatimonadota bacterium]
MRVVYLHQYFLTPDMAGGTRSYEMARRLVRDGHEVHMVTTDREPAGNGPRWRETHEAGIHVHWARVPYRNDMGFLARMRAFLTFAFASIGRAAALRGDVILATSTPLTIAIPALVVSAWKRVPFVFEVRDMWPDVPIAIGALRNPLLVWLARRLELITYHRARRVIALAPGFKDDIVAKGIPAEKVSVISNGCDLELLATASGESAPRRDYPWLGHRKLVLFAGTVGQVNGVDYLVRLAARVRAIDPEIRFVVIGEGRDVPKVRQRAAEAGLLDTSFFLFDAMPKRQIVPWLHAANLFVSLFTGPRVLWKDTVQNKFFDALAAGKPIASNFDGWQARLAERVGIGLTLDPTDDEGTAHRLVAALQNDDWLAGVPVRAAALARGEFDREHLYQKLRVLLESVVSRAGSDIAMA